MNKVWIITGCSTGFGRHLAMLTLSLGHQVVVTARKVEDILDIVADYPEQSLALKLDVTVDHDIQMAVQATIEKFGKVDVLVNNAGIGYFGSIEESEDAEVRKMFEINFWGLMNMTQHVLPHMRKQRSGHILNIASIAGLVGFPAVGFYNATKFAVDGISESLQKEVAHLGIKVTIVSPSGFRTDWAGRSAVETNTKIEDYLATAEANTRSIRNVSGKQAGDPFLAAQAMVKVVEAENPPLHLLLGNGALKNARLKLEQLKLDFDTWEETTCGADAPLQS
jgi:NAD(P)-dependent dehydrogenase (short-subunit alcohol dehydrogenase family)